jgi:hypothetical protein
MGQGLTVCHICSGQHGRLEFQKSTVLHEHKEGVIQKATWFFTGESLSTENVLSYEYHSFSQPEQISGPHFVRSAGGSHAGIDTKACHRQPVLCNPGQWKLGYECF